MQLTKISYLTHVWNPCSGCTPVSAGCEHCYARRMHERGLFGKQPFSEVILHPDRLDEPLRRKKPARIGVCFSGDLFHERVVDPFIDQVFAMMACAQQHTFALLTKRPERMLKYLTVHAPGGRHIWPAAQQVVMPRGMFKPDTGWPLPNCWAGVSVEDQATADERIPWLLRTPAALRYVSYESALGPVGLANHFPHVHGMRNDRFWVICGGESGPGARPCDLAWLRSVVGQCKSAGVPVFVKQLGSRPIGNWFPAPQNHIQISTIGSGYHRLADRGGSNPDEWPEDLRVKEMPNGR